MAYSESTAERKLQGTVLIDELGDLPETAPSIEPTADSLSIADMPVVLARYVYVGD